MGEIRGLTGLRGYAALWVALLHYTWGTTEVGFWHDVARSGSSGLFVFFVLSGFILAYVYSSKAESILTREGYGEFLWARLARVYPLHLATLLIHAALIWAGLISLGGDDNTYTFVLNVLLLHAWGFTEKISWNTPAWTISTEAFAYLLFPFLLLALSRARPWLVMLIAVALFISIRISPHALLVIWLAEQGWLTLGIQFHNGVSLIWWFQIFCFGAALFFVCRHVERTLPKWGGDLAFSAGLAMLIYGCTVPLGPLLMVLGSALMIGGLYWGGTLGAALMANPIAYFLGQISYGLYLSHILVLLVVRRYWDAPLWALFLIATAIAAALFYGLERPMRAWLRRMGPASLPAVAPV